MFKNSRIKEIEVLSNNGETDILVTTNDLTYTNPSSNMEDFVLGAYKILLPLDIERVMQAINYKRHVNKFTYHHPCIKRSELCLGDAMINVLAKTRREGDIVNTIHLLINFLEKPDYGTPYCSETDFYCAQPVTIKPSDKYDWFKESYWNDKQLWDGSAFTTAQQLAIVKFSGSSSNNSYGNECENECGNCGHEFDGNQCPECGWVI